MREVNIICTEINSNKVFEFPAQTLYTRDTHINITRTLRHNHALTLFLHNCSVSLQLMQNLPQDTLFFDPPKEHFFVGQIPNILGSEIKVPMVEVEGLEEGSISLSYQRIESAEDLKQKHKPIVIFQNQILDIFEDEKNNNNSLEFTRLYDGNITNKSNDMLNIQHNLDEQDNSLQNYNNYGDNYWQDGSHINGDFIKVEGSLEFQGYYQSSSFPHEELNFTKTSVAQTENEKIVINKYDNLPYSSQKNHKLIKKPKKRDQKNMKNPSIINNDITKLEEDNPGDFPCNARTTLPRSKERTILSAIEIVSNWRDMYEQSKERRIFRDLQTIAQDLGFSKKVLDYYYLELRTAEFFGFEFNLHLDKKFGKIRRFNQTEKQLFHKNAPISQKIPISNILFYRIPPSNCTPIDSVSFPGGISNSIDFDGDIKIEK